METRSIEPRVLELVGELVQRAREDGAGVVIRRESRLDRELGLDSLARAELIARLERAFGVRLPEASLARAVTPADLVAEVEHAEPAEPPAARPPGPRPPPSPGPRPPALPELETLAAALRWHARTHPEKTHARLLEPSGQDQTLRYGDLLEGAERCARGLLELGLTRGDRLALMLPTGSDYLRCFCAALLLGVVPVPIYPPARPQSIEEHMNRQRRILDNAEVAALVSVREALPLARLLRRSLPGLRAIVTPEQLATSGSVPTTRLGGEDVALIQYTSGSTGDPKGVVLTHRNLVANVRAMGQAVRIDPATDVMVSWLPLYHDMGLIGGFLAGLYYGFPIALMSPLAFLARPERWLWAIHDARGTISPAPNFGYELCVSKVADADIEGLDLGSWRFALNGSEPVVARTIERFCRRFEAYGFRRGAMGPSYGLAECAVAVAFPPMMRGPIVDRILRKPLARSGSAVPAPESTPEREVLEVVACGRPVPGHEIRIVDKGGHELPERREGELEFRGPSATHGYFRNPSETARLFDGAWLRSGDLAYVAAGDVFLTGRIKDLVIRAGRNIHPQELEAAASRVDGVRPGCVVVFASRDPDLASERLVVVAETKRTEPEARAAIVEEIRTVGADLLGEPPDEVLLVPPHGLLKTSSGKIRRAACRAAFEEGRLGAPGRAPALQLFRLGARWLPAALERGARALGQTLYAAYAWLCFALVGLFAWPLIVLVPTERARWAVARASARALAAMCFTPLRVDGLEHLPSAPAVLVSNHQSDIDGFVLMASLPRRFRFVVKSELARSSWTRLPLDRLGVEYVERGLVETGVADVRRIGARARAGLVPLFFPEGTHSRVTGLLPFRAGAFVVAADAGLPIVPIVLRGTRSAFRPGSFFPRRGRIEVEIGPSFEPGGRGYEVALALERAVRAYMLERSGEPDLAA